MSELYAFKNCHFLKLIANPWCEKLMDELFCTLKGLLFRTAIRYIYILLIMTMRALQKVMMPFNAFAYLYLIFIYLGLHWSSPKHHKYRQVSQAGIRIFYRSDFGEKKKKVCKDIKKENSKKFNSF